MNFQLDSIETMKILELAEVPVESEGFSAFDYLLRRKCEVRPELGSQSSQPLELRMEFAGISTSTPTQDILQGWPQNRLTWSLGASDKPADTFVRIGIDSKKFDVYVSSPTVFGGTITGVIVAAVVRHSDASFLAGRPIAPSISPTEHLGSIQWPTEVGTSLSDLASERETRRRLLQGRMPPRTVLQSIIDRGEGLRDPWLDDEND
jgi:hypothetical protein